MGQTLARVTYVVDEYDRARDYFLTILGFELIEDIDLGGGKRWVVVAPSSGNGAQLVLARATADGRRQAIGNQTGGSVAFFLYTDDIVRDRAEMSAKRVRFLEDIRNEPYGAVCVFEDLYGNLWDLIEPAPVD